MLFLAKSNRVRIDNINPTFAIWTGAIVITTLFASSSNNPLFLTLLLDVHLHIIKRTAWNYFMELLC